MPSVGEFGAPMQEPTSEAERLGVRPVQQSTGLRVLPGAGVVAWPLTLQVPSFSHIRPRWSATSLESGSDCIEPRLFSSDQYETRFHDNSNRRAV